MHRGRAGGAACLRYSCAYLHLRDHGSRQSVMQGFCRRFAADSCVDRDLWCGRPRRAAGSLSGGLQGHALPGQPLHGGAQAIPGKVMCAYYDLGGEGVAYHDTDAENHGSGELNKDDGSYLNEFRMHEGVDTSYTKFGRTPQIDDNPFNKVEPPPDMMYVGWTEAGEWFNITVNVAAGGGILCRSAVHVEPRRSHSAGCERRAGDRAAEDCYDVRPDRASGMAAVPPLERSKELCGYKAAGGEVGADGAYSGGRAHEPGQL